MKDPAWVKPDAKRGVAPESICRRETPGPARERLRAREGGHSGEGSQSALQGFKEELYVWR
jgi:hypothetical protein